MKKIVLSVAICLLAASAEAKPPNKPTKKSAAAPVAAPHAAAVAPPRAPTAAAAPKAPGTPREVVRQESKIEFDERMVQGQRASGAIYLFNRGESEFRSLVQVPDSFIQRTIKTILPEGPTK